MNQEWLITDIFSNLLLPPAGPLLAAGVGLLLFKRYPGLGMGLMAVGLASLWLLSTPYVAQSLLDLLPPPPRTTISGDEADAIVILGGGARKHAPEYGGPALNTASLMRVAYGAWLARKTGKPILVTGGNPWGDIAVADVMADTLEQQFQIKPAWVERQSVDTFDNARFSSEILRREHVGRIYLVTSAWHLRRAIPQFERLGLTVVPAGTGYAGDHAWSPQDFLPNDWAIMASATFFHEAIGLVWYRLRNLFGG